MSSYLSPGSLSSAGGDAPAGGAGAGNDSGRATDSPMSASRKRRATDHFDEEEEDEMEDDDEPILHPRLMAPNSGDDLDEDDIAEAEGVGEDYNSNTCRKSVEQVGATTTNSKDDKSDKF